MSVRMRSRSTLLSALLTVLVGSACAGDPIQPADLVLLGGNVVTADDRVLDGTALAARGGRVIAVGTDAEIRHFVGEGTEVVELEGRTAIPGFIEGHGHYTGVGSATLQLNLMDVANWDEVIAMVQAAVAEAQPGELISGRGWHQEKWDRRPEPNVDGLPYHASLSAVSPDNPVILRHASGHATFANAKAMELSGITRATMDPAGGEIVRDPQGNPIGAFRETASGLLGAARRNAAPVDPRRVILLAQEEAFSKGITSFQDAGSGFETVDLMKDMVDDGSLKIRMWVMLRTSNEALAEKLDAYRLIGYGDDRLTVRAIKKSIDGALGSHGAWLLEPYDDLPTSAGLETTPVAEIVETARLAAEHGFQLCVHAIGDRANRETLDIFERAFVAHPDLTGLRWRVEHAQHLNLADIPRFAELGVIASMQGIHATSDGPWVEPKLGAQRAEEGAYVWQKLMQSGAVVLNGTDAPVEDVDPIASYYASVSRMMNNGARFYPDQRMSRMEALKSYTINAAYAAFEEDLKGSLTPGKLADITVLSQDILTVPEEQIPSTRVEMTIVGGEVVYRAGEGS
ncbi:MAG TPA: amidohydrolase [Longimicrobiales bacterium]|nr:amidohydrolase [Longimicrobiales bacterium]